MQNIEIPNIETNRLSLISMSKGFLQAMINKDCGKAQEISGFKIPDECSMPVFRAERRLDMIKKDPEQHPWLYRAIVRKEDNRMIGFINFHHKAPDPDLTEYTELGAELGYTIEKEYRRKGYAKESAIGMMEWAYEDFGVRDFVLTVSPNNNPSRKMAESMNFEYVGEKDDPIDGLELVLKAGIDQILKTKKASQNASGNADKPRV